MIPAAAVLWLALQTSAPATPSPERSELLEDLRAETQREMSERRPEEALPARTVSDLLRVERVDDWLLVDILVNEQTSRVEVPLTDWPGLAVVTVRAPDVFEDFQHLSAGTGDETYRTTQLTIIGNKIDLFQGLVSLDRDITVQFSQTATGQIIGDVPVWLRVSDAPSQREGVEATDEEPINLYLQANTFADLERQHPEEVERYLMPILRDLAPQFSPYSMASAAQVLLPEIEPDEATRQAVLDLLPRLDSDSFRERREAQKELAALGVAAAAVQPEQNLTPEQAAALADLRTSFSTIDDQTAAKLRDDPKFLLEALTLSEESLRRAARKRLAALFPDASLPEVDAPLAPAAKVELQQRLGVSP